MQRLVVVSGWTGAGKSTMANAIATDLSCTIGSFDWLMSALRAIPEVWAAVEFPVELQRSVGWSLLSRVAEQELRRGRDAVLDLVARDEPLRTWTALADRYGARLDVIECVCSDEALHRERVGARSRDIPGWYELKWEQVARGRAAYQPLSYPKLAIDAVQPFENNLTRVRSYLGLIPKG